MGKSYKVKVEGFGCSRGVQDFCSSEAAALAANADLETFRKECQARSHWYDHGFSGKFRSLWRSDPVFEYHFGLGQAFALVLCPVPAAVRRGQSQWHELLL